MILFESIKIIDGKSFFLIYHQERINRTLKALFAQYSFFDLEDILKDKELLEWSRSDSPVRMYLREMGQVALLTKEEEIEISQQIELGEDIIIDAFCSVPYLIDFILDYKEPLINRERRVKELFRSFEDEEEEIEEENLDELDDEELDEELDDVELEEKRKKEKK